MNTDPDLKAHEEIIKNLPTVVNEKIKIHDIFLNIHKKMISGLNYVEILDYLFISLNSIIPCQRMGVALLEDNNKSFKLHWVHSEMKNFSFKEGSTDFVVGSGAEDVIETGTPLLIKNMPEYAKLTPLSRIIRFAAQDGVKSNLTCPLILNGKTTGVIFFSSTEYNTYDESHIELFAEIADGISLIVDQDIWRKQLEESKDKEKLFRHTIHELNNPLTVIKGVLSHIGKKDWYNQLSEDSRAVFNILNKKNESMIALVKGLGMVNHLKGMMHVEMKPAILDTFLNDTVINGNMMGKSKNIKVELRRIGLLPKEVKMDSVRLMQALENLIGNAIKYSHSETRVYLEVSANHGLEVLKFSVIDQGPGIPADELNNLFKEYGKTSVRPTAGESSTGLGLAIVKYVVEAHNGKVSVESTPGKGSIFSFWIPI
jgi:signal transduction histidine kinase